jgi:membrane associated rhomboid family serine protease
MPLRRGENLRSIYVLLFLSIAFFFLQVQDPQRYAQLFAFDWSSVLAGEVWRLFTYQFIQSPLWFFFSLLIIYIAGGPVEEEWGTFHFLVFCLISSVGSALAGALLHAVLLGSFVFSYSIVFVYATLFPEQVWYIFFVLPLRIRWIAYLSIGYLAVTAILGSASSISALAGAALAYGYFLLQLRTPRRMRLPRGFRESRQPAGDSGSAAHNVERYRKIRETLASGDKDAIERLIARTEKEIVPGVNICPPVDFKPEDEDGYCVRCEGFAECSARFMKLRQQNGDEARAASGQ